MSDDKLKYYNPDIIGIFRRKVESNIAGMEEFYKNIDADTWAKVIFGDSSKENSIKENSIDCIITSPPYGDSRTTVAYGQFSRLSAQWIDILDDPDTASRIDNELLGGRSVKELKSNLKSDILDMTLKEISNKDERRAKEVLSFFLDLEKCLKQAFRVLKENKYFCIVIGNRLVRQVRIPTDFIIAEICGNIGFTCEDIFVRNIPNKRMPLKNSPSNISGRTEETMLKESVVILRKSKESKL
jgi:DNA modification methylase